MENKEMNLRFLGKGWKTVTGAAVWVVGHSGIVGTIAGLVGVSSGVVDGVITKIGAALVVLGIAHKIERNDKTTPAEPGL